MYGLLLISCLAGAANAVPASAQVRTGPPRIGTAASVRGLVQAYPPAKPAKKRVGRIVSSGEPVHLGERIVTDDKGRLQILLLDETVFTVGPNTEMVLDKFVYDPETGAGEMTADITQGVLRFITGKIARDKPSNVKVKLPAGTLGIHGTDVWILASADETTVLLRSGSAFLENAAGRSDLERPGSAARLLPGKAPSRPFPAPAHLLKSLRQALSPSAFAHVGPRTRRFDGAARAPDAVQGLSAEGLPETLATAEGIADEHGSRLEEFRRNRLALRESFRSTLMDWDDVRRITGGQGTYAATGAFTTTARAGVPCVACAGSWSFSHTVDFGARTVTGTNSIAAPGIVDARAVSLSFSALSGPAAYASAIPGAGAYRFAIHNADGVPAAQIAGIVTYSNPAGTKGIGAPITASR